MRRVILFSWESTALWCHGNVTALRCACPSVGLLFLICLTVLDYTVPWVGKCGRWLSAGPCGMQAHLAVYVMFERRAGVPLLYCVPGEHFLMGGCEIALCSLPVPVEAVS